jgi:predicted RNase H-like HicB family nuclease
MSTRANADDLRPEYDFGPDDYRRAERGRYADRYATGTDRGRNARGARTEGRRMNCTAVVQQRGAWWIGWIAEVPGVNGQARTREDLLDDLRSAHAEALAMNRAEALAAVEGTA